MLCRTLPSVSSPSLVAPVAEESGGISGSSKRKHEENQGKDVKINTCGGSEGNGSRSYRVMLWSLGLGTDPTFYFLLQYDNIIIFHYP